MIYFYHAGTHLRLTHNGRDGYQECDAPAICLELEQENNDGFAVYASEDGTIVAFSDGWCDSDKGAPPYDAATATGMYDYW